MKEKTFSDYQQKCIFEKSIKDFSKLIHSQKENTFSLFQNFYKSQEELLQDWHKKGGTGLEIARRRSDFIDVLLQNLFEVIANEGMKKYSSGLCIVAFGGYGRSEMNPFSDVDIMFLHDEKKPSKSKKILELAPVNIKDKCSEKTNTLIQSQSLKKVFQNINAFKESRQFLKNYFEKKLSSYLLQPNENKIAGIEKMITSILMVLWDLGLKVGHATRSVDEAIHHANEDRISKTAMLEARFLVGEKKIFNKFQDKFTKKCLVGQEQEYIQWRLENIKKIQEKFGKSVFIQEPNIKSGRGGLRDYQNLFWISLACGEKEAHSYWIEKKFLRKSEQKKLEESYDFLLRVRNEMHYQEKRGVDHLTLRLQGVVATGLGYPQRTILRRSEAFMKDYYQHTREIQLITTAALERMRQNNKRSTLFGSFFEIKKSEKNDGFLIKEKWLFPQNRDIFNDPVRMMRAFHLAQARDLEFSSELSDLIKKEISRVDRTFQHSKEIRGIFLSILSRKGEVGRILRMMHDLGFLGKYLPEFGALTCLVQHEFFHLYTADEHTLVCIEKIDELLVTTEKKLQRYSTLFKNIDDVAILYLAMLLHDTGKAANVRSHAEASTLAAEKVAHRFQLTQDRQDLLITLVKSHGELATVARTRDLDDVTAVYQVANIVRTMPALDALMILTLADGMGTSDTNWSDWKEQLVWTLYNQTKRYFEIGALFFEQGQRARPGIKKEVEESLGETFREEIEAHFEQMPERYLRMMSASQIVKHLLLFRSFFENLSNDKGNPLEAQIRWIELPESGHTEVWICGWDRKRLLERIAAAFLKAEINILSADIFTRRDYLTLDIFRVTSVRSDPLLTKKEKKIVEQSLKNYLENNNFLTASNSIKHSMVLEKTDLNENSISPTVIIENESHPLYTVVKIETRDRQGLFYDLLGALNFQEISINLARIATEKKAAFDTFYLLDRDKKKLGEQEVLNKLKERLIAALSC